MIEPQYYADPYEFLLFFDGLAAVQTSSGGPWGYIDKSGALVIEPRFSAVLSFADGLARVQFADDGNGGYIDKTGKVVWQAE